MEHKRDSDTNCNWCTHNYPQKIGKGTWRLRNRTTSGDNSDYSIIKIGQNTEKSPGDLFSLKLSDNNGVKNSQKFSFISPYNCMISSIPI